MIKKIKFFIISICIFILFSVFIASATNSRAKNVVDEEAFEPSILISYEIGDTISINNWDVTLDSFEFVDNVTDGIMRFNPPDGNKYLYAIVTVTNMDSKPRTFLPLYPTSTDIKVDLLYNNEFTFTITNLMAYNNQLDFMTQTNPLAPSTGALIFSIADSAVDSDELLCLRIISGKQEEHFRLK